MNLNIKKFENQNIFFKEILKRVLEIYEQSLREKNIFRIAVSGGSTPQPLYKLLVELNQIEWDKVEIYLVDERYVSFESEYSNKRSIEECWINRLSVKPKKWIFFDTEKTKEKCLTSYSQKIAIKEGVQDTFFDLILLGVGNDGHTASLFPYDDLLKENISLVGKTEKGDPVKERVSMTYPLIKKSKRIFFLLKGKEKQLILKDIMNAVEDIHQSKLGEAPKKIENIEKYPALPLMMLPQSEIFFAI